MEASPHPAWRKSSYSGDGNNCVEAAPVAGAVAVRDSKNPDSQPVILPPPTWRKLVTQAKAGTLDL